MWAVVLVFSVSWGCCPTKPVANTIKRSWQTGEDCLVGFDTVTKDFFLPISAILLCPLLYSLPSWSHHDGLSMEEPSDTLLGSWEPGSRPPWLSCLLADGKSDKHRQTSSAWVCQNPSTHPASFSSSPSTVTHKRTSKCIHPCMLEESGCCIYTDSLQRALIQLISSHFATAWYCDWRRGWAEE